jgi:hypothetical protein
MLEFPSEVAGFRALWETDKHYNLILMDGAARVSRVKWWIRDKKLVIVEIDVSDKYRRNGIATEICITLVKVTLLPIQWQRTALASLGMKRLVAKLCSTCGVRLEEDWLLEEIPYECVVAAYP